MPLQTIAAIKASDILHASRTERNYRTIRPQPTLAPIPVTRCAIPPGKPTAANYYLKFVTSSSLPYTPSGPGVISRNESGRYGTRLLVDSYTFLFRT